MFLTFCSVFFANEGFFDSRIHSVILYKFLNYFQHVSTDPLNDIDILNIRYCLIILYDNYYDT